MKRSATLQSVLVKQRHVGQGPVTVAGHISKDRRISVAYDEVVDEGLVEAYFGRAIAALNSERTHDWPCQAGEWRLEIVELIVPPSTTPVPEQLAVSWNDDLLQCLQGLLRHAAASASLTLSRQATDECRWTIRATYSPTMGDEQDCQDVVDKSIDLRQPVIGMTDEKAQRDKELVTAADALKKVIDGCVSAYVEQPANLGSRCDELTTLAQKFAAVVLAERISRSFAPVIDRKSGVCEEKADAKVLHAKEIRKWLAPWNLGFFDADSGKLLSLLGKTSSSSNGSYYLRAYGSEGNAPRTASWEAVRKLVTNPILRDITDLIRHNDRTR